MSGTTEKTQDSAAARGAVGSLPAPDETLLSVLEATGVALGLRATDRLAAAHDASHYLLTPQVSSGPAMSHRSDGSSPPAATPASR